MLTVQEEQDRKVKEELEAGQRVFEQKELELRQEMQRAQETSEKV